MRHRRATAAGGTYYFTVNLAERDTDLLVRHIDDLRAVMGKTGSVGTMSVPTPKK